MKIEAKKKKAQKQTKDPKKKSKTCGGQTDRFYGGQRAPALI
jgi:hypothetical protein